MDATRFDALTRSLSNRPTRRATLRLLAGGLLGGLHVWRGAPAVAQAPGELECPPGGCVPVDNPTLDTVLTAELTCEGQGLTDCAGVCVDLGTDPANCGFCGVVCGVDQSCAEYACVPTPPPPAGGTDCLTDPQSCTIVEADIDNPTLDNVDLTLACGSFGARCNADPECCPGSLCCFNGTTLTTVCTDVSTSGGYCPGEAPVAVSCTAGQTDCGGTCVDLGSHAGHCGACFNSCPLGGVCQGGVCAAPCPAGQTYCGGYCADLMYDSHNCGACRNPCPDHHPRAPYYPGTCRDGVCGPPEGCLPPTVVCSYDSPPCCSGRCLGEPTGLVNGYGICA